MGLPAGPLHGHVAMHRGLLPAALCALWLASIERLEADRPAIDALAAGDFCVRSSSLRVPAVAAIDVAAVWQAIAAADGFGRVDATFGGRAACDLDACWVRRQYPVADRPRRHAPHSGHQDGALGFDFASHAQRPLPDDAPLDMLTCWVALTPCGVDAPGLELITARTAGLLAPEALDAAHIEGRFEAADFWRPQMAPGDALLFSGDVLHRTHVNDSMRRPRCSVEFRYFAADALPARLAHHRFARLG